MNCAVDRPSRSTGVNLDKQNSGGFCSVQQNTTGRGNSQTLDLLWTKHHRYT